jgi:hypothetical protein
MHLREGSGGDGGGDGGGGGGGGGHNEGKAAGEVVGEVDVCVGFSKAEGGTQISDPKSFSLS